MSKRYATPWECPQCGCELIRCRGNYAGNIKYVHDVQCWRCNYWYVEQPSQKEKPCLTTTSPS